MHTSYLSLAVFALGAAAAPSFPKPNGDPFAGSFPFFPSGSSSSSDEDSGLSNPVPAYMAAMEAVQSAQSGAYNTPKPTQAAVAKPPSQPAAPESESHSHKAMSEALPTNAPETVAPMMPTPATPSLHVVMETSSTHAVMSGFVSMITPTPTLPSHSMGVHEGHMSSSKYHATPSSSATPTPSHGVLAAQAQKPGLLGLAPMVNSVPILGPMLSPLIGG